MTRDELVALVERIMASDHETEAEADAAIEQFIAAVPHPSADGLIYYWHNEFDEEPDAATIVDRALSYRPFEL